MHPVHGEGYAELAGRLEDLVSSDGLSGDSLADAREELERLDAADDAADRVEDCMEGLARGLSVRREEAGTGGVDGTDRTDQSDIPDYPDSPVNAESPMDMDTGYTGDSGSTGKTGDTDGAEKNPFIDTEDYEDWRFGMEEAVTSAGEILGDDVLYGPHVEALGGREGLEADLAAAREVLGNDDVVLGGYTAAARADQWEAEWTEYVDRAAGDGLDARRTEAGLEMIAQGRTIAGDPSLPPDRLDGIEAVIADADQCHAAVGRYDEWLGEWNLLEEKAAEDGVPVHSLPGADGMIGRARDLADTPSLPGDCREAVRDRIAGHEAHHAAMEMEYRNGGRGELGRDPGIGQRRAPRVGGHPEVPGRTPGQGPGQRFHGRTRVRIRAADREGEGTVRQSGPSRTRGRSASGRRSGRPRRSVVRTCAASRGSRSSRSISRRRNCWVTSIPMTTRELTGA